MPVADAANAAWTDPRLAGYIPMYGGMWTKAAVLGALTGHHCRHRRRITVRMRPAGLRVPGVCGPSKEACAAPGAAPRP